jgi:glucose-6-phosphate isomerase
MVAAKSPLFSPGLTKTVHSCTVPVQSLNYFLKNTVAKARKMDVQYRSAPFERNLSVRLDLLAINGDNFLGARSVAIFSGISVA